MDKKRELKRNLILFFVLVLIGICYIIFAQFVNQSENNEGVFRSKSYIFVKDFLLWHVDDGEYKQLSEIPSDIENQSFVIFNGDDKIEVSRSQFLNGKWYFFDDDYKEVDVNDFRLAYTGINKDIEVANYNSETYDVDDDEIINLAVNDVDYMRLQVMRSSLQKIYIDIDNDGQDEAIYTFTDNKLDVLDYTPVSYLVLSKNGRVLDKINLTGKEYGFDVQEIADIDGNGDYELIVSNNAINVPTTDSCYQIYNVKDGELVLKQDCLYESQT